MKQIINRKIYKIYVRNSEGKKLDAICIPLNSSYQFIIKTFHKKGFTLVELSVVLVIIALFAGGILVGQDLIKSAAIRSQIGQIEEFKSAINTFRVKYGYLAGDMPPTQASQLGFFTFTGAMAGQGCSPPGNAFGNNDGIINMHKEQYPLWSHLSDAKLVKGTYAGTAGNLLSTSASNCNSSGGIPTTTPTTLSTFAKFVPISKISDNGLVTIVGNRYEAPYSAWIYYTNTQKQNLISVASFGSSYIFSPYEMYQIDTKMDDGLPASGNVRDAFTADQGSDIPSSDPPCTDDPSPATYNSIQYDLTPATANTKSCVEMDFLF